MAKDGSVKRVAQTGLDGLAGPGEHGRESLPHAPACRRTELAVPNRGRTAMPGAEPARNGRNCVRSLALA